MKYLVNRETKEHKILTDSMVWAHGDWRMVEADDEGWIKWQAKSISQCPLPGDAKVEVLFSYDKKPTTNLLAGDWSWNDKMITHYRPILPAESRPDPENAWPDDGMPASVYIGVFRRFNAAVAASESIPALIAEINAMLPEGYEVREKAKPEAVTEDMSDSRKWKKGDLVERISGGAEGVYKYAGIYRVESVNCGWVAIHDECGPKSYCTHDHADIPGKFKFHSRPEAK